MDDSGITHKTPNYCPNCNAVVETGILFSYSLDVIYTDELQNEGLEISLAKCLNCERPVLYQESFRNIEEYYSSYDKLVLYPDTENAALKNAPDMVINPYREALKCYRAHAYEASTIMCRKGIEAICVDKGAPKGSLDKKLKYLRDKKILEDTFYNWANELRLIGNDGAHSHDPIVDKQDAKDSIDFFDSLITYLYHLVDKYNKLSTRRKL